MYWAFKKILCKACLPFNCFLVMKGILKALFSFIPLLLNFSDLPNNGSNSRKRSRSSRSEVFCRKGVLRSFAKFTGKQLCQSLFFNKVAGLRRFPVNFVKFPRTLFFIEHLRWLLLKIYTKAIVKVPSEEHPSSYWG